MSTTPLLPRQARGPCGPRACTAGPRAVMVALALYAGAVSSTLAAATQALISFDPSDPYTVSAGVPAKSLETALGSPVQVRLSSGLTDVMRATRTNENALIVGPAHVTASALSHGYRLLAIGGDLRQYVLVARADVTAPAQLKGKRLYLPQQDSLRSYMARGLLDQASLSLKDFGKVEFRSTSGAGLIALGLGVTDATVAEAAEAQAWMKGNPGKGRVLLTSREVPGGLAAVVHKNVAPDVQARLASWITTPVPAIVGLPAFKSPPADANAQFTYVASLGIHTPTALPQVTMVTADEVRKLLSEKEPPVVADVRSAAEYRAEHIPGAVSAPYLEKSLKERDYVAAEDDFSAIARLDRSRPTVFLCNGPECWKSYKAAREASKLGFGKVYWFRGGMPEWRGKGLPTTSAG